MTVGADVAKRAHLAGGDSVQLDTAGGVTTGEMLSCVTIVAGGFRIEGLRVAISPAMQAKHALLGQNFLRHLNVTQRNDQLVMRLP